MGGYLYGALEYNTMGWILAIGSCVLPVIWFANISKPIEPLLLLAFGEAAVPYCMLVLMFLYLKSPLGQTIREDTGVDLSITKLCQSFGQLVPSNVNDSTSQQEDEADANVEEPSNEAEADATVGDKPSHEAEPDSSTNELVKEGLCIMALDVGVQLSKSVAVYLALTSDAATAYQLTALDSYLPPFGIAYTTGMAFALKIIGPIFLSMKEYGYFFKLSRVYLVAAFLLIPLILGATVPFNQGMALGK